MRTRINHFDVGVTVTSCDGDVEWRMERLFFMLGNVRAETGGLDEVAGVNDHEGTLIVYWKKKIGYGADWFNREWGSDPINEVSENVVHLVVSEIHVHDTLQKLKLRAIQSANEKILIAKIKGKQSADNF